MGIKLVFVFSVCFTFFYSSTIRAEVCGVEGSIFSIVVESNLYVLTSQYQPPTWHNIYTSQDVTSWECDQFNTDLTALTATQTYYPDAIQNGCGSGCWLTPRYYWNIENCIDGVCPSPCSASDDATLACGGAENVAFTDSELCTYSCVPCSDLAADCITQCDPFNVNSFDCSESTDGDGNITSLTVSTPCGCFDGGCDKYEADCNTQCSGYYNFECNEDSSGYVQTYDCQCDACSLEREQWADINCHGLDYLDWYDCDSDQGACKDYGCNDSLSDCIDECSGSIESHSCDDSSGDIVQTCVCVNDTDQDNTPDSDPDNTDPNTPEKPDVGDDDSSLLSKIVENTGQISQNTKAIDETLNRELNELNSNTVETNNLIRQSNNTLDDIKSDISSGIELTGSAEMPADNVYDIDFVQPEENSLSNSISGYITSGLPLQQFINNSGFTVDNINPSLNCEVWGEIIDFDISPMEETLNWMGLVIFAVSTVSAFMIVIKR